MLAHTDRAGGFVLHGIDPIAELNLTAWDGFAGAGVVTVRAAAAEERPIALSLSPRNTVPVGGRVVNAGGRPIAGAAVRLRAQLRGKDGRVILDDAVAARDGCIRAAHRRRRPVPHRAEGSRRAANTTPRRRPRADSLPGRRRPPQSTTPASCPTWCSGASGPPWARSSTARAGRSPATSCGSRAMGRCRPRPSPQTTAGSTCPASSKGRQCSLWRRAASSTPCNRSMTGPGPSRSGWRLG